MRNGYRHPLAGIVLMVLICALIGVLFSAAGTIAFFGRTFAMTLVAAIAVAAVVLLVLFVLHRAGVHRISKLQTWPQK